MENQFEIDDIVPERRNYNTRLRITKQFEFISEPVLNKMDKLIYISANINGITYNTGDDIIVPIVNKATKKMKNAYSKIIAIMKDNKTEQMELLILWYYEKCELSGDSLNQMNEENDANQICISNHANIIPWYAVSKHINISHKKLKPNCTLYYKYTYDVNDKKLKTEVFLNCAAILPIIITQYLKTAEKLF